MRRFSFDRMMEGKSREIDGLSIILGIVKGDKDKEKKRESSHYAVVEP